MLAVPRGAVGRGLKLSTLTRIPGALRRVKERVGHWMFW